MNPFLQYPPPERAARFPIRLYGRFEEAIDAAGNRTELLFGAIDANWFDTSGPQRDLVSAGGIRIDTIEKLPVYLLEVDVVGQSGPQWSLDSKYQFSEDDWLELHVNRSGGARLYPNLYGDPVNVTVTGVSPVSPAQRALLDLAHSLDEWTQSDEDVQTYLASLNFQAVAQCAVYDVGQGSAVGLSDSNNMPSAYFDFGGGTRRHTGTRPHSNPQFCLTKAPLIILSHWHDDHWSSGPLQVASLSLTWLAPHQHVTGPHLTIISAIKKASGRLIVTHLKAFSLSNASFERATGKGTNNSGFWAKIDPPLDGQHPMLFSADASYHDLSSMPSVVDGMAVTHHGADWKHKTKPPGCSASTNRAVFSFGSPNFYGHPTGRSRTEHGHFSSFDTVTRAGGASGNVSGHVKLDWAGTPPGSAPCGNKKCYQNLDW
ncbi:hypothetical protein [Pararhizobium sp.]|uniref:hypothetical protein n=1 Tax=Pararhizobium sp. TaxID=1977563 RepID=UPI003D12E2DE